MSGVKVTKTRGAFRRPEEPTNMITYAVCSCVAFVGLVFLLIKTAALPAIDIWSAAIFGAVTVAVFFMGVLACAVRSGGIKTVAECFGRCEKTLLTVAVFAPLFLTVLGRGDRTDEIFGYVLFAVVCAAVVADISVKLADVGEHRVAALSLYVLIGLACVMRLGRILALSGNECFFLVFGSYSMLLIGTVSSALGGAPGRIVNRLFVAGGATLNFVAVYSFLY